MMVAVVLMVLVFVAGVATCVYLIERDDDRPILGLVYYLSACAIAAGAILGLAALAS